ncbi:hypothetical protein SCHPADRAFT_502088 [Schizopora paradoxa]|uniref:Uncharacterized protein n=1 Tax=Schizopora paradoxa TaxID=27342 RepID=A0A0H2RMT2_9AGAM|nr:hypothetical protein SCHPADRAFT_502088 [Schizopora paradoxa]
MWTSSSFKRASIRIQTGKMWKGWSRAGGRCWKSRGRLSTSTRGNDDDQLERRRTRRHESLSHQQHHQGSGARCKAPFSKPLEGLCHSHSLSSSGSNTRHKPVKRLYLTDTIFDGNFSNKTKITSLPARRRSPFADDAGRDLYESKFASVMAVKKAVLPDTRLLKRMRLLVSTLTLLLLSSIIN